MPKIQRQRNGFTQGVSVTVAFCGIILEFGIHSVDDVVRHPVGGVGRRRTEEKRSVWFFSHLTFLVVLQMPGNKRVM